MKIGHNQVCVQCEQPQEEVITLTHGENEASFCEPCLNLYLDGEITFVDAHDFAE